MNRTLSQVFPKQASFHANVTEALVLLGHAVINGRRNAEHFIGVILSFGLMPEGSAVNGGMSVFKEEWWF